ncbi:MAG: stalk domain-containing protein [Armatimonadetes bacterium]|nr:stalk domain-containing protein [Armatimonadota bacterium]
MKSYTRYLIAALMMALAVSAMAAPIVIPRDAVIPVTLDNALGSATNRVGDRFSTHYEGSNDAGFPDQTKFTGTVESLTKASGKTAGQIGVGFVSARLPDGTWLPINGRLTSLDNKSVKTDPATGRLMGTSDARKADIKFAAIGAGAGLVIGQIVSKKPLIGTLLGAAAGYLYGRTQVKAAVGKDVEVAEGTQFGILLDQNVTIPEQRLATPIGAGPDVGPGWNVTFKDLQPLVRENILMVPFRSVMSSIDMPFNYDSSTKTVRMNTGDPQALYTVGTKLVYSDGKTTQMDAASRIINGSLYVPASYIELLTHRTAYWSQQSGVLRIE